MQWTFFYGVHEISADSGTIILPPIFRQIILRECGAQDAVLLHNRDHDGVVRAFLRTPSQLPEVALPIEAIKVDENGRIHLPPVIINRLFKEHSDTVVLNGMGDLFEIWTITGWREVQQRMEKDFPVPDTWPL